MHKMDRLCVYRFCDDVIYHCYYMDRTFSFEGKAECCSWHKCFSEQPKPFYVETQDGKLIQKPITGIRHIRVNSVDSA